MATAPLTQFVLKVHSRCDLACDHCYMYEHADQSWRRQPRVMTQSTVRATAHRIAEHAAAHRLPAVTVVLHGGEPLLMGEAALGSAVAVLRATVPPSTRLDLRMQTNGVLLSPALCEVLLAAGVRVGVSLDGDRTANDRHRRYANGGSSYEAVLRALALLRTPRYRPLYAGLLCTVDIVNDPVAVYEALRVQEPPQVDFLLPHATWEDPPHRPPGSRTPYARWLLRVREHWLADGRPMGVRLFESIESTARGGAGGSEWVGLEPADLAVVETDGSWEQVDSLKTAYAGAPKTGLDVFADPVDAVAAHPGIARRQTGLTDLSATCRSCEVVRQCGGGLYAHRYRSGSGFDNPSVYCADLKELITVMNERTPAEPVSAIDDGAALPPAMLDDLASGHGRDGTVSHLIDSQYAITRALVVAAAGDTSDPAWQLLRDLDQEFPDAVRSVLAHPYVRVWAVGRLRGAPTPDYLACLAAATAVRAGPAAELRIPLRGGRLHFPTLGTAVLPPGEASARVTVDRHRLVVRAGDHTVSVTPDDPASVDGWHPTRRVGSGDLRVALEDGDPQRDCHDWPVDDVLSPGAAAAWTRSLHAAAGVIARDTPEQLPSLRALRTVTPLVAEPNGGERSSTARDAFGAVAAARAPGEPLAVLLVHELQHVKLGAVLDLCDLVDPAHTQPLRVGWRPDPRPAEGVLQGTYAHLAVAAMWRARASTGLPAAAANYRRYRDWTASAAAAMLTGSALTPVGARFVRRVAETLASWPA